MRIVEKFNMRSVAEMAGCCECGDEPLGFIKYGKYLG
jgi:hypothetical protein